MTGLPTFLRLTPSIGYTSPLSVGCSAQEKILDGRDSFIVIVWLAGLRRSGFKETGRADRYRQIFPLEMRACRFGIGYAVFRVHFRAWAELLAPQLGRKPY